MPLAILFVAESMAHCHSGGSQSLGIVIGERLDPLPHILNQVGRVGRDVHFEICCISSRRASYFASPQSALIAVIRHGLKEQVVRIDGP